MKKYAWSLLFLAAFPQALRAADVPAGPETAQRLLVEAIGADDQDVLRAYGYVVLHGEKGSLRLEHLQLKALEDLAAHAQASLELSKAYDRYISGSLIETPDAGFSSLSELTPEGLMNPDLHKLSLLLADVHEQEKALGELRRLAADVHTLYEASWAKEFVSRNHLDSLDDFSGIPKHFFDEFLGGPRPLAQARAHLNGYLSAAYKKDISAIIDADAIAGTPSEELRAWLNKYLVDQRRLFALRRDRSLVDELEKKGKVSHALSALVRVAGILHEKPELLKSLRETLARPEGKTPVGLTTAGLHLQAPAHLEHLERGDRAVVTGAYWVDGLPDGRMTVVELTTFADYGDGSVSALETRTEPRPTGGPYSFSREIPISDSRPFAFRSIISARDGRSNSLSDKVDIEVSDALDLSLLAAAQAENKALSCDPKEAEAAFTRLEENIAAPAKEKKQYADLLNVLQRWRYAARRDASRVEKLEEQISQARADSAPQLCHYDTRRTDIAIKAVRALPPGCDKYLPELLLQRNIIARRLSDQLSFARAAEQAKRLRHDCAFAAAVDTWADALAIIAGDPAARCGAMEDAIKTVEAELASARVEEIRQSEFAREYPAAQASADKPAALAKLRGLIAAQAAAPTGRCFESNIEKAARLAESIGYAMPTPALAEVSSRLQDDRELPGITRSIAVDDAQNQAKKASAQAPSMPPHPASETVLESLINKPDPEKPKEEPK